MANGAPELVPPGPLGRSLLSYVADPTTAQLYKRLFDRVRQTGSPVVLPIRCDSPALRRFLDLRVSPRPGAGFRLSTVLVRAEPRPPERLLDRTWPRGEELVRMCAWCKRVAVAERWLEVEAAVPALGLFEREVLPQISHGICPRCREGMEALLDA